MQCTSQREGWQSSVNLVEPDEPATPTVAKNQLNINTDPPTLKEVRDAIQAKKSGKTAG